VPAHPMVAGAATMNDAGRRWHKRSRWEHQIRRGRRSRRWWGHRHRHWRNDTRRQAEDECREHTRPNREFHPSPPSPFREGSAAWIDGQKVGELGVVCGFPINIPAEWEQSSAMPVNGDDLPGAVPEFREFLNGRRKGEERIADIVRYLKANGYTPLEDDPKFKALIESARADVAAVASKCVHRGFQ
jgi:hypothetical protein